MLSADAFGLSGKVALVVGGGLGIGEETALRLAQAGCDMAVVDLDEARAHKVAQQVRALGRRALPLVADVLDEAGARPTIAAVEAEFGRLDILATIVGQAVRGPILDITPENWDLDQRRNLRYFVFYARAAAEAMVRGGRGGAITAVGSVTGIVSGPGIAAYAAAKAGLHNFARSMAVELAAKDIRVNVVAPGTLRTPRGAQRENFEAWEQRIRDSLIPARRLGETKEVADAILFLSSALATYITGHVLAVDGGYNAQTTLGLA